MIQILYILSKSLVGLLPTKDPRCRTYPPPTQRKPNKISQSLIHNQVPNIPITIHRIPIQGNPIILPTYSTHPQTKQIIKIIIALTKVHK